MDPEWKTYLSGRYKGNPDYESARTILKRSYSDSELPLCQKLPLQDQQSIKHQRQRARYTAEWKYFERSERRKDVEKLLGKIVDQRYRDRREEGTPVNLVDVPVRRLIAAERLYQRKLIKLSGHSAKKPEVILVGLDVDETLKHGPKEHFLVQSAQIIAGGSMYSVACEHRSEASNYEATAHPMRLGHKFVSNVRSYVSENVKNILDEIPELLQYCTGIDTNTNRVLSGMFREFCQTHCLTNRSLPNGIPNMRTRALTAMINRFLRNSFLFLFSEQSQIQSAHFFRGDKWKLGMAVSFARLVRLFEDEHITLRELFEEYALYSNKGLMKNRTFEICKENCRLIDELYQKMYPNLVLDEEQAMLDLVFLYGDFDGVNYLRIWDLDWYLGDCLTNLFIHDNDD